MKTKHYAFLPFLFLMLLTNGLLAQSENQNTELNSSGLMYSPQLPKQDSYKIVKNETGAPVSETILMEINKYRKAEEDFTWRVSDKIEILIYARKK